MRNRVLNATDPTDHRDLALDQGGGGGVDIRLPLLSKGEAEKALKSIGQTAVTTASFIPGVGDAIDVYDFMAALYRGEYGEAGFVLAAAALPGSARAARNVGGEVVERIARNLDELPDGSRTFVGYHGTSSEYADSIRQGINPPTGANFRGRSQLGDGFYTTPDYVTAQSFASHAANRVGGTPVVLEIYATNFNRMSGIVASNPATWWGATPQKYINNYDMIVAPISGMPPAWQVKFNPRTYGNLIAE